MEKAAYLGCEIGRRACLRAEVRWIVEKDRRVIGEEDFSMHLGRALEKFLRDMLLKRELDFNMINGLVS